MNDQEKREKVKDVINAFERVVEVFDGRISGPYFEAWMCATKDALALLKAQEPRVMTLEEVEALPYGHVLIETDKSGSLRWLDALLFCKNTNFSFDFITLEGRARLLGTEYNREWRCWTSRPTDEQKLGIEPKEGV